MTDSEIIIQALMLKVENIVSAVVDENKKTHFITNEVVANFINRQKAEIEELQELVETMGDYFPACIDCEGKTPLGERTDKCVYEIDNTNYCTKRGITNIVAIQKENRELRAEIERLKEALTDHEYGNCVAVENGLIYTHILEDYNKLIDDISAEARKEFAERLKGTFPQDDSLHSTKKISEDIDNLFKEPERKENISYDD